MLTASVRRLRLTMTSLPPSLSVLAPCQSFTSEKSSEKVSAPRPGKPSSVGDATGVGNGVQVDVGGNQTMVAEGATSARAEEEATAVRLEAGWSTPGAAQAAKTSITIR